MITWHKKNSDPNVSTTLDANGQQQVSDLLHLLLLLKVVVCKFLENCCALTPTAFGREVQQRQIVLEGSSNYYNMTLSVSDLCLCLIEAVG
jgi:hypothetical protein